MKKKVYLISFEYFPISQGGLARHAQAVIDRLLKYEGFKPLIAVPRNNKIKIDSHIITIPCIFFGNKYLCYLEFALRIFFRFRDKFDHNTFIIFSLLSYFLLPILPKRFYLFVHSNEKKIFLTNYPEETIKDRFIRKIIYFINYQWESWLCKKSQKIFSVSPSLKDETVRQYNINKNKIVVIKNGLDTNVFSKKIDPKKLSKDLLFVGKISYRKNVIDLVKILKSLTDTDPLFKLHIMGRGEKEYLHKVKSKISEYNLDNKVFFHAYRTDVELNNLYEKCSIFVLTSLVEGFGLVVLEAMAKGMPVVAYDNLGVRDIINGTNGYLIDPFDYQNFVGKILNFYSNKNLYKKMSENAVKTVDKFSWDRSVNKLVKELQ